MVELMKCNVPGSNFPEKGKNPDPAAFYTRKSNLFSIGCEGRAEGGPLAEEGANRPLWLK